jgi:NAD-dependent DNA ligase
MTTTTKKLANELENKIQENEHYDLSKHNFNELIKLLTIANHYYHEKATPIIQDDTYDYIYDYIKQKDPKNSILSNVGSETEQKVVLPYHLGSMDKIKRKDIVKTPTILTKWTSKYKGKYTISEKLDGISILMMIDLNKNSIHLYTRGNGTEGRDVSNVLHLLDVSDILKNLKNKKINNKSIKKLDVRGELIISKKTFENYQHKFENARNMIGGLVNHKDSNKTGLKKNELQFIAFEIIEPRLTSSEQFNVLQQVGFTLPQHEINIPKLSLDLLTNKLNNYSDSSDYEIDGIIITDDNYYSLNTSGNPKHSFAFKENKQVATVTVKEIIWQISRHGYFNPVVEYEPVKLSGATLHRASGKNAKFIKNNKIGRGAILKIVRSGEVIPDISSVIKPMNNNVQNMPKQYYDDLCYWTKTGVDLRLENMTDNDEILIKNIVYFFKTIKTGNMDVGTVKKLITNGYDTIPKIIKMNARDLENLDGFQKRLAQKIVSNIQTSIIDVKLLDLMVASNVFERGLGSKKMILILQEYPDVFIANKSTKKLIADIIKINGFSEKLATLFCKNMSKFIEFVNTLPFSVELTYISPKSNTNTNSASNNRFDNMKIVFTGFRDKELQETIENEGGSIMDTISKNTSILVLKNKDDNSSKKQKALTLGITILGKDEFKSQFNI